MEEYLAFAKDLANQSGDIMLEHFQVGVPVELKPEAGNTPVTIADKSINRLVIDSVRAAYPSHAVLGEEESMDIEGADFTWVCDPIDGTAPYSMGIPTNVFSLALVDAADGQPKVAVVFDPHERRLYHALSGGGAFMNEEQISVNRVGNLSDAFIGTSSHTSKLVDSVKLKAVTASTSFRQLSVGSVVYEAMLVATGQIAAQLFVGSTAHDVAAAKLIVDEAGGRATDLFGGDQRYDEPVTGSVFSNGLVHDGLVSITREHRLR